MNIFHNLGQGNHEEVLILHNARAGLRGFLVIHDTTRGPAMGGVRVQHYPSEDIALGEAIRLSRQMSLKTALADLPCGGGKIVLMERAIKDRKEALEIVGAAVERYAGRYYTARDLGATGEDVESLRRATRWVCHEGEDGVDSLPQATAVGLLTAMRAAVRYKLGKDVLKDMHVAIQGVGRSGGALADLLAAEGARLTVSDWDEARAKTVAARTRATLVAPDAVFGVDCDVFSPCAIPGVINPSTIPLLKARFVIGSSNGMLRDEEQDARLLMNRGIIYVPEYVANAGAVIQGANFLLHHKRQSHDDVAAKISASVEQILGHADQRKLPTNKIAEELALGRLKAAKGLADMYPGGR